MKIVQNVSRLLSPSEKKIIKNLIINGCISRIVGDYEYVIRASTDKNTYTATIRDIKSLPNTTVYFDVMAVN